LAALFKLKREYVCDDYNADISHGVKLNVLAVPRTPVRL